MIFHLFLCLLGFVLLSYASDKLVEGASNLAINLGISKLAVGMTIVAAGTSLPEMVVSVNASLKGNPALSLGNVVGSNIMNAALILGVAALIQPIACERQTVKREVPIMIGAAILLWIMAHTDQIISFNEGLVVAALFFVYIYLSFRWSRQEPEYSEEIKEQIPDDTDEGSEVVASTSKNLFYIVTGLIGLVLGSESLVRGATFIARSAGVSDEVIGLTLIAIGTSLPELATAIAAAKKGHSELTLGNVVGSNIFNIFGIVGCASIVSAYNGIPGATVVEVSNNMLGIHIPMMVVVSLSVLPIMSTGLKIVRAEGALLLAFYFVYNIILLQSSPEIKKQSEKIETPSLVQPQIEPASPSLLLENFQKETQPIKTD